MQMLAENELNEAPALTFRLPDLADLEAGGALLYRHMLPTPQYSWPLLNSRVGTEVWVKHENHTPIANFKVRGGIVYLDHLRRTSPEVTAIITATRGNYGQSIGFAAAKLGLRAVIVVPRGNSREKNAAMRALGVELIEEGEDFQAASEHADRLSRERGLHRIPNIHPLLEHGVGVYALEFFRGAPELDAIYVQTGLGSGICGVVAARNILGRKTEIIGVVSAHAPAYALSFAAGKPVSCPVTTLLADGVACRTPDPGALEVMLSQVSRFVTVTDDEVAAAMRAFFHDTHNLAEGAGAMGLAALLQEKDGIRKRRVGIVLSGGNVDTDVFAKVLSRSSEFG
jgi:threonine dehydratase